MINIETVLTGPLGVNTYIVSREGASECVVIDPADAKKVYRHLDASGLTCKYILLTHGHFDHILGVKEMQDAGARVFIGEKDADMLYDNNKNLSVLAGTSAKPCQADEKLIGGEVLTLSGIEFRVIATPGHSEGGLCYVLDEVETIFTGDTIFRLSVGRTDLNGGSGETLLNSIVLRLYSLSRDYRLLPGHTRETTLNFEREHNPCTKRWSMD